MKHNHYHKSVRGLNSIDVYRVLRLFEVNDPCLQHAIKKLLCAGYRGSKSFDQDVKEAIDTLERWKAMRAEDDANERINKLAAEHEKHTYEAISEACGKKIADMAFGRHEPAAQMDDDSERMAAIGQNGNDGAHYSEKKPDWKDAPDWAMWLAQDPNGGWFFYECQPVISAVGPWMPNGGQVVLAFHGRPTDSSGITLERRP